ncbi:LytTR family DNA-binding domain-containing protein [Solimonas marina]|nr:LytTR family DNA-binding domain-containing protein [Solimonas marina]
MSGFEHGDDGLPGADRMQAAGAEIHAGRGLRRPGVTSGTESGTGERASYSDLWWGLLLVAAVITAFNSVNVMSDLHDMPGLPAIEPIIWEASSWVTFLVAAPLIWLAVRLAPLSVRPRWRLALHLPVMLLFSLLHVVGFMLIRKAAYALGGGHYAPSLLGNFLYEFRKDMLGYVMAVLVFSWVANHLAMRRKAALPPMVPTAAAPAPAALFDIRDGAALIRVPIADIHAVTAAGNYVEFVLADGRRPLMRCALSVMEAELGAHGFVRTHRSWLVNPAALTALRPEGSGAYTVVLGALEVPLSRRYRTALERLRERPAGAIA